MGAEEEALAKTLKKYQTKFRGLKSGKEPFVQYLQTSHEN